MSARYAAGGSVGPGKRRRRSSSAFGLKAMGGRRGPRPLSRLSRGLRYTPVINPTFTECVDLGVIPANSGGVIAASMGSIPEVAQYAKLYRSFRITKFEAIWIADGQQAFGSGTTLAPTGIARLAISTDKTSEITVPTAEADVIADDRVSLFNLDKVTHYTVYNPVPSLTMNDTSATPVPVGVSLGKGNWLSFGNGNGVLHNGAPYWLTQVAPAVNPTTVRCYLKITFQCTDPQ